MWRWLVTFVWQKNTDVIIWWNQDEDEVSQSNFTVFDQNTWSKLRALLLILLGGRWWWSQMPLMQSIYLQRISKLLNHCRKQTTVSWIILPKIFQAGTQSKFSFLVVRRTFIRWKRINNSRSFPVLISVSFMTLGAILLCFSTLLTVYNIYYLLYLFYYILYLRQLFFPGIHFYIQCFIWMNEYEFTSPWMSSWTQKVEASIFPSK